MLLLGLVVVAVVFLANDLQNEFKYKLPPKLTRWAYRAGWFLVALGGLLQLLNVTY